jgi:hypothetical protein
MLGLAFCAEDSEIIKLTPFSYGIALFSVSHSEFSGKMLKLRKIH